MIQFFIWILYAMNRSTPMSFLYYYFYLYYYYLLIYISIIFQIFAITTIFQNLIAKLDFYCTSLLFPQKQFKKLCFQTLQQGNPMQDSIFCNFFGTKFGNLSTLPYHYTYKHDYNHQISQPFTSSLAIKLSIIIKNKKLND